MTDDNGEVIEVPFLRTRYNYTTQSASELHGLECPEPSLAQQQFKEESDINTIVERFGITGQLPENVRIPEVGDFSDAMDFHTSMNVIRAAEEAFMEMPAKVRERFGNDPGAFLDWAHDENNLEEARKLGLAVPKAAADPGPGPTPKEPQEPPKSDT